MQYLKDEVRKKIAEEALKEFTLKGYEGASVRNIAKNSNNQWGICINILAQKKICMKML